MLRGSERVGRQLLMVLFESEDKGYTWLNSEVCVGEGVHGPHPPSHLEVYLCKNELI